MTKKIFLSFIIAVTFSANSTALTKNSELYKQSFQKIVCFSMLVLTDATSNSLKFCCDNLKFYHDKDGISDKEK
jgi:hypothetical protein